MATIPNVEKNNLATEKSSAQLLNAMRNSYPEIEKVTNPVTDFQSYQEFGQALMNYEPAKNRFIDAVNRIVEVIVNSRSYTNPWKFLKKGIFEMGDTIEEIFVNVCDPHDYDIDKAEEEVFKREMPDVRSAFYTVNYEKRYKQTVMQFELRRAFLTMDGVNNLIVGIVNAIYTSSELDEFLVMKYLVCRAILNNGLYVQKVPDRSNSDNIKKNVAKMRSTVNRLGFLTNKYNQAGVYNVSRPENVYFMVDADFEADMSVEVLASAFNVNYTDYPARRVLVDSFSDFDEERLQKIFENQEDYAPFTKEEKEKLASVNSVVFDEEWFRIYDNLMEFTAVWNGEGLYWNYNFHNWKTMYTSPFANAIMFTTADTTYDTVTVEPSAVTVNAGQVINLKATVTGKGFPNQKVTYTSDNEDVATVTSSGAVYTKSAGTATVTVTCVGDPKKTTTSTITVE